MTQNDTMRILAIERLEKAVNRMMDIGDAGMIPHGEEIACAMWNAMNILKANKPPQCEECAINRVDAIGMRNEVAMLRDQVYNLTLYLHEIERRDRMTFAYLDNKYSGMPGYCPAEVGIGDA
jgi:hypothetical protein